MQTAVFFLQKGKIERRESAMEDEKRPKFTKEYLNSSLFRIGSLVTQGKLSADDFPLRAYTLRMNYTDIDRKSVV